MTANVMIDASTASAMTSWTKPSAAQCPISGMAKRSLNSAP